VKESELHLIGTRKLASLLYYSAQHNCIPVIKEKGLFPKSLR